MGITQTGIITQARMGSTRLPGKILLPVKGKPLLLHHVERLRESGLPVVVATSSSPMDDIVEKFCKQNGISCYRGDEYDVLSRFYACALQYGFDRIVRVTADCPLADGRIIGEAARLYEQENNPRLYLSNCTKRTFPRGFDFEIFSFNLLELSAKNAVAPEEREHVTPYLNRNVPGSVVIKDYLNEKDHSRFRLTVDTPEDFTLIKVLMEKYEAEKLSAARIMEILVAHPELAEINAHVEQKKISQFNLATGTIYFRADGNDQIGLGHLVRSLALAEMLGRDFRCVLLTQAPLPSVESLIRSSNAELQLVSSCEDKIEEVKSWIQRLKREDIVVLDGYDFTTDFQEVIKQNGNKLVCIDDIFQYHFKADVIINQAGSVSPGQYSAESYTKFCLGPEYLLLRPPFLKAAKKRREISSIHAVFINAGGSDTANVTEKLLKAALKVNTFKTFHVVVGPANLHLPAIRNFIEQSERKSEITLYANLGAEELCRVMSICQFCLCSGSTILLEACSVGMGICAGQTAWNQSALIAGLESRGTIVNSGDFHTLTVEELTKIIEQSGSDMGKIQLQLSSQKELIDGQSDERLRKIFLSLKNA